MAITNPPRGDDRTGGLTINEPAAAIGYTLFVLQRDTQKVYLLDPLGRVAHIYHIQEPLPGRGIVHAKLMDNANLLIMAYIPHVALLEIDPRGNIVWRYDDIRGLHHDFLKMPNGNILMLAVARKTRQEAIAAGANPQFVHHDGVKYDYLLEVRPTYPTGGEIVWQWSAWDHLVQDFDPAKPNYGAIADRPERIDLNFLLQAIQERRAAFPNDWLHTNAIDYNPQLDQIMLSPRHFSELWIIDRSTTTQEARGSTGGNSGMGGDLIYRWGNPRAYARGDTSDQRLFWQHHTHWIPPGLPGAGNILVFNNGNEMPGDERLYSSVDEIVPPVDGYRYRRAANSPYSPDALEWTYVAPTPADFYAPYISGAQRLPNGNTLITDGTAGTIFQATPDGKTAWKYTVPWHYHISLWQDKGPPRLTQGTPDKLTPVIKNIVYRAYWYPPDHPGLQALDLTPAGPYLQGDQDLLYWARHALIAGDFGEPLARSHFDIYIDENALIYFKPHCAQEDAQPSFFLHIYPAYITDIPARMQERGFQNKNFNFQAQDVHAVGDSCMAIALPPRYQIERIKTGQQTDEQTLWSADITIPDDSADPPFDIRLDENALTYSKPHCAAEDTRAPFYLHIFPARAADLPAHRREHGFDALDFNFDANQIQAPAGGCASRVALPNYAIDRIRTGQHTAAGPLWRAGIKIPAGRQKYGFDIRLDESARALTYSRRICAQQDTRARFYLHIYPVRPLDLPAHSRERGFDAIDFNFEDNQVQAPDGGCIAARRLPGYPIERIRTGQYTPSGKLWRADLNFADNPLPDIRFDIRLSENILTYAKQPCVAADARRKFFLHIIPVNAIDLPAHRQEYGFDALDFNFHGDEVKISGDRCAAAAALPTYPIRRILTGQFTHAEGKIWQTEINPNE